MRKFWGIILVIFFMFFNFLFAEWQSVGDVGFSPEALGTGSLSIAVTGNVKYVSYLSSSGILKVMKYDENGWTMLGLGGGGDGSVSDGTAEIPKLLIDNNGNLYVVYKDNAVGGVSAKVYDEGTDTWSYLGLSNITGHGLVYMSATIYNNEIFIFTSASTSYPESVYVYDGTNNWINLSINDKGMNALFAGIAADGNDVYVAYCDYSTYPYGALVQKYTGSNWSFVGPNGAISDNDWITEGSAYSIRIELDSNNTPYIAYIDGNQSDAISVKKFNGLEWEQVGIAGFSDGSAYDIDFYIEGTTPYVAYRDVVNGSKLTVQKFNGSSWETLDGTGVSAGESWGNALNVSNEITYVAYRDSTASNYATLLKHFDGVSPIFETNFSKDGDEVIYRLDKNSSEQFVIRLSESLMMSASTTINSDGEVLETHFGDVVMGVAPQGSPFISMPAETNPIAQAINVDDTGALFVTASFQNVSKPVIMLNGIQITDLDGNPYPGYENYIRNVSYDGSTLTFEITHFSEYGVPVLVADDTFGTAGTAPGDITAAVGNLMITLPNSDTVTTTNTNLEEVTSVLDIHGLSYETVLSDVPSTINNLYKPLTPGTTYNISFEYINRGNETDTINLARTITRTEAEHYTISDNDSKSVDPWQVVSFNVEVNAYDAYAYERATVDVAISMASSVVSYSAFADAYIGGTYNDSGQYGGLGLFNNTFVLEAEGVDLEIVDRIVSVNAPIDYDGVDIDIDNIVPGSKIIYSIVIRNNNGSTVPSIDLKDVIPQNCHLFYYDAELDENTPTVNGVSESLWEWRGAIDNTAVSTSENAVWFEITIPPNTVITASYTVTLD